MNSKASLTVFLLLMIPLFLVPFSLQEANATTASLTMSNNISQGGTTDPATGVYYYTIGQQVNITAYPNSGYLFDGWLIDGQIYVNLNPWSFSITHNTLAQATFVTENMTLIIQAVANGTTTPIAGTYSYAYDSIIQITAIPDPTWYFANWAVNGGISQGLEGINPLDLVMDQNITIYPIFTQTVYIRVTLLGNIGGSCNLQNGNYSVIQGNNFTVNAISYASYQFDYWLINGTSNVYSNPLTITINNYTTIQPYFKLISLPISLPSFINLLIVPGMIIGALGWAFSRLGDRAGEHGTGGFLIGGYIGVFLCTEAAIFPMWFLTVVTALGLIGVYLWYRR